MFEKCREMWNDILGDVLSKYGKFATLKYLFFVMQFRC